MLDCSEVVLNWQDLSKVIHIYDVAQPLLHNPLHPRSESACVATHHTSLKVFDAVEQGLFASLTNGSFLDARM